MIIYPSREGLPDFTEAIEGFNRSPKAGDTGHVNDHAILSEVVFDLPQHIEVGTILYWEGEWFILPPRETDPDKARQVSFAEVREFAERPGVHVIYGSPSGHPDADGVTDHTDEATVAALENLAVYAAGLVGLSHVAVDLAGEVFDMKQRLVALESAQA